METVGGIYVPMGIATYKGGTETRIGRTDTDNVAVVLALPSGRSLTTTRQGGLVIRDRFKKVAICIKGGRIMYWKETEFL